jgi:hypothetical protein
MPVQDTRFTSASESHRSDRVAGIVRDMPACFGQDVVAPVEGGDGPDHGLPVAEGAAAMAQEAVEVGAVPSAGSFCGPEEKEGPFSFGDIAADRFPEPFLVGDDVEEVVLELEGASEVVSEFSQRVQVGA